MRISAKTDYAVRAAVELVAASREEPLTGERVADAQGIPLRFLENILGQLRQAGLVASRRGADGGYWLALPPEKIAIADVIRAIDGPLANVNGTRPEGLDYSGSAAPLRDVWVAVRASVRTVLEEVTLKDVVEGRLPAAVARLTKTSGAWDPH